MPSGDKKHHHSERREPRERGERPVSGLGSLFTGLGGNVVEINGERLLKSSGDVEIIRDSGSSRRHGRSHHHRRSRSRSPSLQRPESPLQDDLPPKTGKSQELPLDRNTPRASRSSTSASAPRSEPERHRNGSELIPTNYDAAPRSRHSQPPSNVSEPRQGSVTTRTSSTVTPTASRAPSTIISASQDGGRSALSSRSGDGVERKSNRTSDVSGQSRTPTVSDTPPPRSHVSSELDSVRQSSSKPRHSALSSQSGDGVERRSNRTSTVSGQSLPLTRSDISSDIDPDFGPDDSASQLASKPRRRHHRGNSTISSEFEKALRGMESGYSDLVSGARYSRGQTPTASSVTRSSVNTDVESPGERRRRSPAPTLSDRPSSVSQRSSVVTPSQLSASVSASGGSGGSRRSSTRVPSVTGNNAPSARSSAYGNGPAPSSLSTTASRRDPIVEVPDEDDYIDPPTASSTRSGNRRHRRSRAESSDESDVGEALPTTGRRRGRRSEDPLAY